VETWNDDSVNRRYCGLMYASRIIYINVNKKQASLRDIFIFGNPLMDHRRSYWSEFTAWHLKYDVRHAKRINIVKFKWSKKRLTHVSRELYIQTSCFYVLVAYASLPKMCVSNRSFCPISRAIVHANVKGNDHFYGWSLLFLHARVTALQSTNERDKSTKRPLTMLLRT